jgi:thiol-disulfide isomerase/thioredoxin
MMRITSLRGLVPLALCSLLLAACVGGEDDTSESTLAAATTTEATTTSTTTTSTTSTTTTTVPPTTTTTVAPAIDWQFTDPADLPVVTLLDAGREPTAVRFYNLEVGATRSTTMRNVLSLQQSIDGTETANLTTDTATEFTATVVAVDETGITIESTFGPSTVVTEDPATRAAMERTYAELEGLTAHSLMSPGGETLAVSTTELPAELGDFTQSVSSAMAAFPAEPIGEGAEWETVAQLTVTGITFIVTTRVRLLEVEDSRLTVEMDIAQTLGPDGLVFPGVDKAEVDLDSTGSATAIWDLTAPLPIEASSTADQTLLAILSLGGQKSILDQTMSNQMMFSTDGGGIDSAGGEAGAPDVAGDSLPPYPTPGPDSPEADPGHMLVAPEVSGHDFDGTAIEIRHDGTPKAIVFQAHWCQHCQAEVPRVTKWLEVTGGVEGVDMFSVSTSLNAGAANYPPSTWLESENWPVPTIRDDTDNSVHRAYGYGGFPFWVFLDGDGRVFARIAGELDIEELQAILTELAGL